METYVYKRRADGTHVINLRRTWEKLVLAARAVVAIENPADVFVISSRPFGQRAVLKFAAHTGATPIAGRFTPGAFTNQVSIKIILILLLSCQFSICLFAQMLWPCAVMGTFYYFFYSLYQKSTIVRLIQHSLTVNLWP